MRRMKKLKRTVALLLAVSLLPVFGLAATAAPGENPECADVYPDGDHLFVTAGMTADSLVSVIGGTVYKADLSTADPGKKIVSGDRFESAEDEWYILLIRGDGDSDGEITPSDARLALRFAVGLDEQPVWFEAACSVDNAAGVEASDARIILRAAVGLETLSAVSHTHEFLYDYNVPPTCSEDGFDVYVCSCGETKSVPTAQQRAAHYYKDGACVYCGDRNGKAIVQKYKDYCLKCFNSVELGVYMVHFISPEFGSDVGIAYDSETDSLELYLVALLGEDLYFYLGIPLTEPDASYPAYSFVSDGFAYYYYGEFSVDVSPDEPADYQRFDVFEGDPDFRQDFAAMTDEGLYELFTVLFAYLPDELTPALLGACEGFTYDA